MDADAFETRVALWLLGSLALVFFLAFLLTAGGCSLYHKVPTTHDPLPH